MQLNLTNGIIKQIMITFIILDIIEKNLKKNKEKKEKSNFN